MMESDYNNRLTEEQAEAMGDHNGCTVIFDHPRTLLIDVDKGVWDESRANRLMKVMRMNGYRVDVQDRYDSRHGAGEHVVLAVDPPIADKATRACLQAAFGSDPVREALAVLTRMDSEVFSFLLKPEETDDGDTYNDDDDIPF